MTSDGIVNNILRDVLNIENPALKPFLTNDVLTNARMWSFLTSALVELESKGLLISQRKCKTLDREVSSAHYPVRVTITFSCGNAYSGFGASEMEASLYALRQHPHALTD